MKSAKIIIYKNLNEIYQPLNQAQNYLKLYEQINESPLQFITNQKLNQIVNDAQEAHELLLPYQLSSILQKSDDCNYILLQQCDEQEQINQKIEKVLQKYTQTYEQQKILYFNISEQKQFNHIDSKLMYLTFESQNNQPYNIHKNITRIPLNPQNELITYTQMQYLYKNIIANQILSFNPSFIYISLSITQQLIFLEGILCIIRYLTKSKSIKIIVYLQVRQQSEVKEINKYLITICNGLWGNKPFTEREFPSEKWLSEMVVLLQKSNLIGESKIFQQVRANLCCLNQLHKKEQKIKIKIQRTIQLFDNDQQLITIQPIDEYNKHIEYVQFHIDYNEQIIVLQSKTDFRVFYYLWQFENLQERQFKTFQVPLSLENPSLLVKDGDILICYGFYKNQFNDQIYLFQIEYQLLQTLNRNKLLNLIKYSNCNFQVIHNRNKPGVCKNSILGEPNQFMLIGGEFEEKNQNQAISLGCMNIIEFVQYDKQSMMFHSEILDKTSNCFKVAFLPSPLIVVLQGVLNSQNYVFVIDDLFHISSNQPINRKQFVYMITAEQKKKIIIIDKSPMIVSKYPKIKAIRFQYTQYLNSNTHENSLGWNIIGNAIIEDLDKFSDNIQQNLVILNCQYNQLKNTFYINYIQN